VRALVDASSIYEATRMERTHLLEGLYSVEIARYEIGNILWKHTSLLGDFSPSEAEEMMQVFTRAFAVMSLFQISGHEREVLGLGCELKIPYYDASYIYFADRQGLSLITEDAQLAKKGREMGLDCFPATGL
jgi:predicted nucleic acid-binding protein